MTHPSALVPFVFEGERIRVVMIDGKPWFVLADCCSVLGLTNPTRVAERLKADGLTTAQVIDSMGRTQSATIVDEPNLYRLIFQSRKSNAERFQDFVFETVLPEIRKTGAFLPTQPAPVMVRDVDMLVSMAERLRDQRDELDRQSKSIAALDSRVTDVEAVSPLVGPSDLMTLRDLAHACDTGRTRMARWLRDNGVMFTDQDGHHRLMQHPWMEQGLARESWERTENGMMFAWVPRWTPRGIARIRRMRADLP